MWRCLTGGTILLLGCVRAPAPAPAPVEQPLFTIHQSSLGPLTSKSQATLVALRDAFAGYDVAPVNGDGVEYRISLDGTRLFDVIPDEQGNVLNVHVVTPKIAVADRPWRVGAPFDGVELVSTCECWADQTVCFKEGEHVAVALAKLCREGTFASQSARRSLSGVPIRTAIWSPRPLFAGGYAPASVEEPDEPDPP